MESSFFFLSFLSSSSFFSSLPLSLSTRRFNTYQIPILFLSLVFFFSLFGSFSFFCPPLTLPLPSIFFSFSYSFPIPFLLLVSSPFCCFSFSLSSLSSFLPHPCPNACPTPPLLLQKNPGENTVRTIFSAIMSISVSCKSLHVHARTCLKPDFFYYTKTTCTPDIYMHSGTSLQMVAWLRAHSL